MAPLLTALLSFFVASICSSSLAAPVPGNGNDQQHGSSGPASGPLPPSNPPRSPPGSAGHGGHPFIPSSAPGQARSAARINRAPPQMTPPAVLGSQPSLYAQLARHTAQMPPSPFAMAQHPAGLHPSAMPFHPGMPPPQHAMLQPPQHAVGQPLQSAMAQMHLNSGGHPRSPPLAGVLGAHHVPTLAATPVHSIHHLPNDQLHTHGENCRLTAVVANGLCHGHVMNAQRFESLAAVHRAHPPEPGEGEYDRVRKIADAEAKRDHHLMSFNTAAQARAHAALSTMDVENEQARRIKALDTQRRQLPQPPRPPPSTPQRGIMSEILRLDSGSDQGFGPMRGGNSSQSRTQPGRGTSSGTGAYVPKWRGPTR